MGLINRQDVIDVKAEFLNGYMNGLDDAWEAVKRIILMHPDNRRTILGWSGEYDAFDKNTASEAIEKLKAWEQKQDEIQVGDEVIKNTKRGIVTGEGNSYFEVLLETGAFDVWRYDEVKKTGKHFQQVAELLKQMKEER